MNLGAEQIRWILIDVLVLIISVAFHEFGHAVMAHKLGDNTPERQGRVTLNPIAHIDPIGTLVLPLVGGIYGALSGMPGGFGWGKPVQWQPSNVNRKWRMSTASILVSIAGPAMNVFLAVVIALVHVILIKTHVLPTEGEHALELHRILMFAVGTNFVLFFFNLIPAPPLDGGHLLRELMPYRHREAFNQYARFGPFVVMAIALIPILQNVFLVPAEFCVDHLYSLLGSIFGM
jgi:Zn-dependent protease